MQCFACNREGIQRCPRCGNAYCEGHGTGFCAACLDPLNAAPSRSTFRIALIGLLGGCVLALWLLIRPPDVPGESSPAIRNEEPTPALTPAGAGGGQTSGASGSVTPVPSAATTPQPSSTGAAASAAATPTPVPGTPAPLQYVVQEGDTWFGIAEQFGVDVNTLAAANGRTASDADVLHVGETLIIPQ